MGMKKPRLSLLILVGISKIDLEVLESNSSISREEASTARSKQRSGDPHTFTAAIFTCPFPGHLAWLG